MIFINFDVNVNKCYYVPGHLGYMGDVVDRLKIDQVASQSGLTKRTIRYYEELNLIEQKVQKIEQVRNDLIIWDSILKFKPGW